jgi:hypothetical protein
MLVPITETTEIKPPTIRINGSCVLRYTRPVKATREARPTKFRKADLVSSRNYPRTFAGHLIHGYISVLLHVKHISIGTAFGNNDAE